MRVLEFIPHDHYCKVVLGRDDIRVTKYVRLGNTFPDFIRDMAKAVREADRDISMQSHGDLMHCEDTANNRPSA